MKNILRASLILAIIFSYGHTLKGQTKEPVLSGEDRVKMFSNHSQMKKESSYSDLHWQYIGPTNISGRCTDVEAVTPRGDSYTIWVGSATGGVWKSENEGSTFEPVFDDMPTASIGDIAIDPDNPDVVWVGTGEANIFRSSNAGCGVFKTTDGGKTWKDMGLNNTMTIGRIKINPKNSDEVYVAATGHEWTKNEERGLFKTTDGGRTWEKILYLNDSTGVFDLIIHPRNPRTIYCTTWERTRLKWNDPRTYETTESNAIWKSTNAGKTWKKIVNGLPAPNHLGRIGIDICLSNPDVLYALVDNYEIAYPADPNDLDTYGRPSQDIIKGATVYKTNNGGDSWKQVSGLTQDMKIYMERHSNTYGWVFGQIRVDPTNPETVFILGVPISKSVDGGKTFERLRGPHSDHHGLWIDPNNSDYIINAQDGGITISYDQGETWKYPIEVLPLAQFYNIEYDMNTPFRVFGSIQDHHSFYGEVDLSRGRDNVQPVEFPRTLGAEGSTHAINKNDNNTLYASSFYGKLARAKVDNYPAGQKDILPTTYPGEPRLRGQWVAPTLLSPHNQEIVYHCMQYVLRSEDKGNTWEYISPDLTYNDPDKLGDISYQTISAFDESPLKFGLLYAGTDDGRVWRTKDGGKNWTEIRNEPVPERWVSRITASRYDLGTVYMTQTGRRDDDFQVYIWKSTDYGDTWTDLSGNIPVGPVNVIREDPINNNILYVGTDAGVYVSKDGGKNYEVLGDLPFAYVHDLQVHPRDNMLIIATHGRGVWVLDANDVNHKDEMRRRRRW